jgi:hypothetical protein
MSRSLSQDTGVIAFEDHDGHLQAGDREFTDDVSAVEGLRRHVAMGCGCPDQPLPGALLRDRPLMNRPAVPRQKSNAPKDESAAHAI